MLLTLKKFMIRVILALLLALLLTGCSFGNPSTRVIEQAIALQWQQTQTQLEQQLGQDVVQPPQPIIHHISILHREQLLIQTVPCYRVQGAYDLTLKFADHQVTQHHNSFDLYLQPGEEEKSWMVVHSEKGEPILVNKL